MRHVCYVVCEEVIRRYGAGDSFLAIEAVTGLPAQRIKGALASHGIPVRGRYADRRAKTLVLSERVAALARSGQTARQIATAVGVGPERVRQLLAVAGVTPARALAAHRGHVCGPACAAVLAEPTPVGLAVLARRTGISIPRIVYAARRHNIRAVSPYATKHDCAVTRCADFLAAIRAGQGYQKAAEASGHRLKKAGPLAQRLKIYHPDWPWPSSGWWRRHASASENGEPLR